MKELKDKSKLKKMNIAMIVNHSLNTVISVFVSTFLISYIYTISGNYIRDIALFYCFNFLSMGIFYYIVSVLIDKTDRVTFYRFAILIRAVFILIVIFLGKNLANYVILSGILHGFSEACYWGSYNLMKNELVSKHAVDKYSMLQYLMKNAVTIIIPLIFGKIIDIKSFKVCTIIVFVVAIIELIFSIFINSKRPENASFKFGEYCSHVKNLGSKKKFVVLLIVISCVYGLSSIISPLNTILIMLSFDSNFSLGILTSVFALMTMVMLIVFKRFTKLGKRNYFYIIFSIIPIVAMALLFVNVNRKTVVLFSFSYYLSTILYTYSYDIMRNLLFKKLNLYDDIAEFQCSIELAMEFARVVIFVILAIVGIVVIEINADKLTGVIKILSGLSLLIVTAMNIGVMIYEKQFKKEILLED